MHKKMIVIMMGSQPLSKFCPLPVCMETPGKLMGRTKSHLQERRSSGKKMYPKMKARTDTFDSVKKPLVSTIRGDYFLAKPSVDHVSILCVLWMHYE